MVITLAHGTGGERDRALDERADVRLHRLPVLGQDRLLDLGDQPLVGEVHALDLHLDRLLVQEVVQLGLGVVADRLVGVDGFAVARQQRLAVTGVAGVLVIKAQHMCTA